MPEDTGVVGGAERDTRTETETPPPEQPPEMNQSHDVLVGDKVQLNGTLFTVSSGEYDWKCKGPDGDDVPLTNPTMPGPSFTAEQAGAYVTTLTTDDGVATITVNATDPDASTAPPPTGESGVLGRTPTPSAPSPSTPSGSSARQEETQRG